MYVIIILHLYFRLQVYKFMFQKIKKMFMRKVFAKRSKERVLFGRIQTIKLLDPHKKN